MRDIFGHSPRKVGPFLKELRHKLSLSSVDISFLAEIYGSVICSPILTLLVHLFVLFTRMVNHQLSLFIRLLYHQLSVFTRLMQPEFSLSLPLSLS